MSPYRSPLTAHRSLLVAAYCALLALFAGTTQAWSQGKYRPGERIVLSDFSHVQAVAATRYATYAATTEGITVYDRRFNRWEPPVTRVDGFPDALVHAALIDPADESLWLASDAGLIHFHPTLRQLDVLPTGPVHDLMFDRDDPIGGVYLRGDRGGWELLPRGAFMPSPAGELPPISRRVQPVSLEAALRRFPAAQALGATALLDRRLRRYRYTSAAITPGDGEVFFGTDGMGMVRFDALAGVIEPLPFGLRSRAVGAVELIPQGGWVAGGAWIGTNAVEGMPAGFARVPDDLQVVRYEEGGAADPLFREVHDLLVRGPDLWAATERGLVRFQPGSTWRTVGGAEGTLPGDRVFALAHAPAGIWVGTDRGLAVVSSDGAVTTVGQSRAPVHALLASRDSLWVGTVNGLRRTVAGSPDLFIPDDVAAEPALAQPIVALARSIDTLVAATPERIIWKGPRGGWIVERVLSPEIGDLRALAGDREGVWIGGSRGLAFFRFNGRSFTTFRVGADLPGGVTRIVVAGPYLWIGTERGLVRFQRRALVP